MKTKRNVYQFSNFILDLLEANGLSVLAIHFPALVSRFVLSETSQELQQ